MFSKRVKHYHQWLRSAIPFKAKLDQIPSDSIRVQGPTKRPSLGHLYPVSLVKERHRKGGKRKISRVLQSPVPSTQASPKVEASHRLKQAQHFSPCRKVQNGNPGVHPDFPGPRGVGIVDRPVGRIPSHPHPSKLKEVPKVLLQGLGVPVHLPTFRTGHSPPGLYDDRKGSETNGPLKRTQNSPIPGRLADQVPVPGGISRGHTGSGRPNPILGLDNQPGKIRTEYHLDSALVRPTHERWLKLQDLILRLKSKRVLTARCLMSLIGLLASTEKTVPEGRLHMRPFQFHLKEHWRYPQSLDNLLPWTEAIVAHLDWWQNPSNVMKGADLHPKDHSIQLFTDASNEGWGAHLDQNSTKGLWSEWEKRLHPILGLDNQPGKIRTEYHLDSALVRPTHERWLKLQDLILRLKSKRVLTARCLMSLIGLLASTEKTVPEGRLHMRPFQFHLKEHWRYPQSLDNLLPWTEAIVAHLDWWQNPSNVMKGADLHPKDHSIQLFTDASNEGWGAHLDQNSTKGLWSEWEKRLHINVLELKAVSLALRDFKDQCQNQTVLVATDNSTVVAYINKQGGTHSAEMCALLWKIMTWCHHYHITLKARHIPGCLNVMADLLSRSNQVQSTEWSLHPQVFKQICRKWFTPHVDLFATHLNHKLPLYVSPIPDPRAWNIDALNINWTNLTAYAYPPTALLHKVIHKIKQCHCLIIVIAPGWPGMPWFWDLVQLSTEIPLQLPVSTTLLKQSHNYVFHNNPQQLNLHAWCLGADNSKNKASLWKWQRELLPLSGHQQGPSTGQSGPYLKNGAEKIRWISPLHL